MILTLNPLSLIVVFIISSKAIKMYPNSKWNLIWYESQNINTYIDHVIEIDTFLKDYPFDKHDSTSQWGACTSSNSYSFSSTHAGPCIFLSFAEKLKETPESYNSTTLPTNAPEYLRNYIRALENARIRKTNHLAYVTCSGKHPVDEENIGALHFFRNFEISILPHSEPSTFAKDVIAVYFEKPMRNIIINVECKIWANFKTDKDLRDSIVTFDLLID